MKKRVASILIVMMIILNIANVSAAVTGSGFTHPELGEFLKIDFKNGMPFFTIYDFMYYEVVDSLEPFRGMVVNQFDLIHNKMTKLDASINALFDSVENPAENEETAIFSYGGISADYSFQLEQMPREDRIKAIKLLNGFEGVKGYKKLLDIPGMEYADIETLENEHTDYTVKIGNTKYPYRVLMFHFAKEEWVEYNERYCYLKIKGEWKLARVTKEYTDDFSARGKYIHGLTGSLPYMMDEVNAEALRGTAWGLSTSDVETIENVQADGNELVVEDVVLYRLPATLTYIMKNKKLAEVEYTFANGQAYYSAFISLYTRYSDPILINEQGDMTWSLNDMTITLHYHDATPVVVFTPYK